MNKHEYKSLAELTAEGDPAVPELKAMLKRKQAEYAKAISLGEYSPEDEAVEAIESTMSWHDCPSLDGYYYLLGYYRALITCGHPGVSKKAMRELFFAMLQFQPDGAEGGTPKEKKFDAVLEALQKVAA